MNFLQTLKLVIFPSWKQSFRLIVLSIISVSLGIALIVSVFNANESIIEQFNYSNNLIKGKVTANLKSLKPDFKESDLNADFLQQINDFSYTPILQKKVFHEKSHQVIDILGVDLLNDYKFRQYAFEEKNPPIIDLLKDGGLVFSAPTREKLALNSSNSDFIYGSKRLSFKISHDITLQNIGLAKSEGGLIAICDLKYLQKILGEENTYTSIDFTDVKISELKSKLNIPSGFRLLDPSERRKEIENLTQAFRFNLQALSFIALFVSTYLIFQTIFISFQRKNKLIGILRSLGATKREIFNSLLLEAALIGLIGVFFGCALGLALSKLVFLTLQQTVNELYFSAKSNELIFSPKGLIIASSVGILACLLAALPSAYLSLKVSPAANLRSTVFRNFQRMPRWLNFAIYSLGFSLLIFLFFFQENLFHFPNRFIGFGMAFLVLIGFSLISGLFLSAAIWLFSKLKQWLLVTKISVNFIRLWIAMGALICGLSMTISISFMIDSFRETVKDWIGQTLKADIYISSLYQGEIGSGLIQTVNSWPEIEDVDTLSGHQTNLNDKPINLAGVNLKRQAKVLIFIEKILPAADLTQLIDQNENYIFISNTLARKQNLSAGNFLELMTFEGKKVFQVAAVYQDYSSEHGYILMRKDVYQSLFHDQKIKNVALYLKNPLQAAKVRGKLSNLILENPSLSALKIQTNWELRKNILEIFNQTFKISYLFFWIALVISIFTVSLTLFSCIEENGYLNLVNRYLGAKMSDLLIFELVQGILITLIALVLSLPCGYWLAYILRETVNNNSFGWIIYFHPNQGSFLFIACLAMIGALIGSIYPIISSRKIIVSNALVREIG